MRLDTRTLLGLALLFCLLLLDWPELGVEWQFFLPGNLDSRLRVAPVLQADPLDPAIDRAFTQAAPLLAPTAICVIALDAWHRDYFRASYLLMPRQVWPYQQDLTDRSATSAALRRAMQQRHATCLLAAPGVPAPRGLVPVTRGVYDLYLSRGRPAA
jgi:hypothetical protein